MTLSNAYAWPDDQGRFGPYGGRFVSETLMPAIHELDAAYAEFVRVASEHVRQFQFEALRELLHRGLLTEEKP